MKYRLICLAAAALMLAAVIALQDYQPRGNRDHQHREAAAYTPCQDHGEELFCTHLPLFNIVTDAPIPAPHLYDENGKVLMDGESLVVNDEMVGASVQFFTNPEGNNHLTDTPDVSARGRIRTRGNTSRRFDKKGYLLKFTQDNGVDGLDVSLDTMAADNSWVLHGPILDKTLLRNYLCYNITGQIMEYVPEVRFCELFLNGEYQGLYVLTEKIKYNEAGRCDIQKTDPKLRETSFILKMDKRAADPNHDLQTFFDFNGIRGLSYRPNEFFEIIYPNDTLTQPQKEYIISEISLLEKTMASFDLSDRGAGYSAYLDMDSFVDYYVLNQFMLNVDAGHLSTYYCKDLRGKIKIIGWDYNNVFNNFFLDVYATESFSYTNQWYGYLLRDARFVKRVVERYHALRETILSDAYLEYYILETIEYLGPAVARNNARWGYTYTREYCEQNPEISLSPLERNPSSYDQAVAQLVEAIQDRGAYLDTHIEALYANCHASVNKQ